ncbi:MAG: glycosyltransferase family 9 protein [Myxococcaceae bacterium]
MQPALERLRSILILRYSALGDVVLATSVLDPLRERYPDAKIEWVVDSNYAPLLDGLPQLHRVHRLKLRSRGALRRLIGEVQGRFDVAIDLQNKVRTRVLSFAASERTVRFVKRGPVEAAMSLLGREQIIDRVRTTEMYAEALAPLGVTGPGPLHISVSEAARTEAAKVMAGCTRAPVTIAPGSRWATKRWGPEKFARVAEALHSAGEVIALAGGPGDVETLNAFRSACRVPISADLSALSVEGLAAAIGASKLLVACDSGPVHIATALGVPSVVVFGPTSIRRWGPPAPSISVSLQLSCSPCTNHGLELCPLGHHNCMRQLEPEAVIDAALRLRSG